jgi:P-type Mg2+ transporter
MEKRDLCLKGFWDKPLPDLLRLLQSTPSGLTSDEAKQRLRFYGPNSLVPESRFAAIISFFRFFANPLVIILLLASGISMGLGNPAGGRMSLI